MTAPALLLNSTIVGVAWVKSIASVAALNPDSPPVSRTLPAQQSWAQTGYLQVITTGGSPDPDFPLRKPMFVIYAHAVALAGAGKQPPWDKAARLIQYVFDACYDETLAHSTLTPIVGTKTYPTAYIKEVNARSEPIEVPGDPAGYARYRMNLELAWVS